MRRRPLRDLLAAGTPVFGAFAVERSGDGGRRAAADPDLDFVFYDLEEAEWDMGALRAFVEASLESAGGGGPPEVLLRIPPVAPDPAKARVRVAEALEAGVHGLILPHVESPADVATVAQEVGARLWAGDREGDGDVLVVAQIESRPAVERAGEIAGTRGVGVVLPGQADLRRSYGGDEAAVQAAVDGVLAAARGAGVPCGVTAGRRDMETRLHQGFEFIIGVESGAAALGRAASDRES